MAVQPNPYLKNQCDGDDDDDDDGKGDGDVTNNSSLSVFVLCGGQMKKTPCENLVRGTPFYFLNDKIKPPHWLKRRHMIKL